MFWLYAMVLLQSLDRATYAAPQTKFAQFPSLQEKMLSIFTGEKMWRNKTMQRAFTIKMVRLTAVFRSPPTLTG
jgi:hypothetical protein